MSDSTEWETTNRNNNELTLHVAEIFSGSLENVPTFKLTGISFKDLSLDLIKTVKVDGLGSFDGI